MTVMDRIEAINLRIKSLKARGETMNARIISKLERRKRLLEKSIA